MDLQPIGPTRHYVIVCHDDLEFWATVDVIGPRHTWIYIDAAGAVSADRGMSGRFRASAKEAQSRKTAPAGSGSEAVGREAIAACPDAVELLCCAPVS